MGMTYVIGFDEDRPTGQRWTQVNVNSMADILLSYVIENAIGTSHPDLYEMIMELSPLHFVHFDKLSEEQFRQVVNAINHYVEKDELSPFEKRAVETWNSRLAPLLREDKRYRDGK